MSDEANPLPASRLIDIKIDDASLGRGSPDIEHEREVAIYDLLEANSYALEGREGGPYTLLLSMAEDRLVFSVGTEEQPAIATHLLSLSPFRRIVKDYFFI